MPSVILSDNGVSSGSAGLKTTAASDGALVLQTSTAGGTATNALYIDTSQNVGIGTSSPNLNGYNKELTVSAGTSGTARAGINIQGSRTTDSTFGALSYYHQTNLVGSIEMIRSGGVNNSGAMQFFTSNAGTLAERMRLDTSGNLGLGVTPSAWSLLKAFQVGTAAFAGYSNTTYVGSNLYFDGTNYRYISSDRATLYTLNNSAGQHQWSVSASGTAGNAITFTQAMTLDASGNLLVGATSNANSYKIYAKNNNTNTTALTLENNNGGYQVYTSNSELAFFQLNVGERARIDSSGVLLVGTTTKVGNPKIMTVCSDSLAGMHINGSSGSVNYGLTFYYNSGQTGQVSWNTTTTTYATSSDYRLKENIAPMTGALAKVSALKPCTYTWKSNGEVGEGFIAHELAEVVPDAVTGEKDATEIQQYEISPAVPATFDEEGNELTPAVEAVMGEREVPKYQGIDTSFLVATLTAAIQEQQALITQLQADVAALKAK